MSLALVRRRQSAGLAFHPVDRPRRLMCLSGLASPLQQVLIDHPPVASGLLAAVVERKESLSETVHSTVLSFLWEKRWEGIKHILIFDSICTHKF